MIDGVANDKHPLYQAWRSMRRRCTNPKDKDYLKYGGRGIKVCEQWEKSFETFVTDVGERPAGRTLDRIDNDLGYQPGNVRWATGTEQLINRRQTPRYEWGGETLSSQEWARVLENERKTIEWRMRKQGDIFSVHRQLPYSIGPTENGTYNVYTKCKKYLGRVRHPNDADELWFNWVRSSNVDHGPLSSGNDAPTKPD